jgi:hypothetical protein
MIVNNARIAEDEPHHWKGVGVLSFPAVCIGLPNFGRFVAHIIK